MGGGEAGANLPGHFEGLIRRQPPDAAKQRGQVFAVDILHGEEREAIRLADVEDAADVAVGDLPGYADFAVKAGQANTVLRDRFREEFQRHGLAELEVFRAIDFAHAAASGHGHDAVAILEDRARDEARAIEGVGGRGNPATGRGAPLAR